jgi:MFS transporter, DHA1 family, multidrug resistance protein
MEISWKRNLYVLWTGIFFCSMAYSMSIPFLPLFLNRDLGVENHLETWSGLAFGISFLASALIAPYWGSLSDKYGRKPMILRSGFSLAIIYMLTYFVNDPYELLGVRILQGLLAGYVPSSIALVATNTPEKQVGYALGIISTAGAAGSIIGPLVGGVTSRFFGYRESYVMAGVAALIAALIAWIGAKETNFNRSAARSSVVDDLKEAGANRRFMRLIGLSILIAASVMVLEPLLTIYVLKLGASHDTASLSAGFIFSAVGISTVLAAPIWGKIGGKIGYRNTLFIGLIGGGIGNLLQYFFHSLIGFGTLRFVYGFFFAAVYPSINALIVESTPSAFRGRAFGLNQSANQIGTMAGPIAGGAIGSWLSIPIVFILNGLALIFTAIGFVPRPKKSKSSQAAEDTSTPTL